MHRRGTGQPRVKSSVSGTLAKRGTHRNASPLTTRSNVALYAFDVTSRVNRPLSQRPDATLTNVIVLRAMDVFSLNTRCGDVCLIPTSPPSFSLQGYFLLFESMLDSVLYARDLYLADGGSGRALPVANHPPSRSLSSSHLFPNCETTINVLILRGCPQSAFILRLCLQNVFIPWVRQQNMLTCKVNAKTPIDPHSSPSGANGAVGTRLTKPN